MKTLVFSDASVNPRLKTGFGAYLALTETGLIGNSENASDILKSKIRVKRFTSTSSTQLEIETLVWALWELIRQKTASALVNNITVYTDSQSLVDLPDRRTALEQSGFISTGKNEGLTHSGLYKAFYQLQDNPGFELKKLKGHSKRDDKSRLDEIFSYVDRAARKALREHLRQIRNE